MGNERILKQIHKRICSREMAAIYKEKITTRGWLDISNRCL